MKFIRTSALVASLLVVAGAVQAAEFPRVRVETTAGAFVLQLDDERAPLSVANFLKYVEAGFYTGTIFHRIVSGFVIQGGGFTVDLADCQRIGQRPGQPPHDHSDGPHH